MGATLTRAERRLFSQFRKEARGVVSVSVTSASNIYTAGFSFLSACPMMLIFLVFHCVGCKVPIQITVDNSSAREVRVEQVSRHY